MCNHRSGYLPAAIWVNRCITWQAGAVLAWAPILFPFLSLLSSGLRVIFVGALPFQSVTIMGRFVVFAFIFAVTSDSTCALFRGFHGPSLCQQLCQMSQ